MVNNMEQNIKRIEKSLDDPLLKEVLAAKPDGFDSEHSEEEKKSVQS